MAFVRLLGNLLKDTAAGPAHRAHRGRRGAHLRHGQPVQAGRHLFQRGPALRAGGHRLGAVYREALDGQILEEGISEAGAIASWTAAATSYSVHGLAMLPFYIYYSMFGFQRVGDAIWAAADQRARGFLLGATSGRTTLGGEGLQHQDGSSHLVAATIPNCKAYDPAFAGEMAVIVDAGMREMLVEQQDVFYYVTLMNENYAQPDLPAEAHEGVMRGGYRFARYGDETARQRVTLLGSGAILTEVVKAAQQLAAEGIAVRGVQRHELERAGARRRWPASSARCAARRHGTPSSAQHAGRGARPGRSPPPTTCAPCRRACAPSCPPAAATSRWAPTASAAATRARRCASSSASMRPTS